jgi:UPF0716 protein FxsA
MSRFRSVRLFLFLLLLAAPFLDLVLLVLVAHHVGAWPVIGFVVLSALAGGRLAKRQGHRVLRDLEEARSAGQVPREGLLSAALLALAGVFLVVPGLVSTLFGVALLVPAVRRLLSGKARRWFERRVNVVTRVDPGPVIERADELPDPATPRRVIDIDEQGRPVP